MIESEDHKENLIKFTEKYRNIPQSFPQDKNGKPTEKYLEYLSLIYDAEAIKIVLELDVLPEMISISKLSRKLGIEKEELLNKLEPLIKRGFVFKLGPRLARPTPLYLYDLPFALESNYLREDVKEFARLSREFFEEGYYKTWENTKEGIPLTRVLTVSEEVEDPREIVPYEEVYKIIDQHSVFAVVGCPCRRRKEIEGIRKCKDKYPIHNCLQMGIHAEYLLNEIGDPDIKRISKEEAKKITKEAAEIGLVHTTDNRVGNFNIICACCECCCGFLSGLTRFDNPRAIAKANYISHVDSEKCVGCETCLTRCKFDAITVDDVSHINIDKCMGCGLCAVTCPQEAITMKRMERETIQEKEFGLL